MVLPNRCDPTNIAQFALLGNKKRPETQAADESQQSSPDGALVTSSLSWFSRISEPAGESTYASQGCISPQNTVCFFYIYLDKKIIDPGIQC